MLGFPPSQGGSGVDRSGVDGRVRLRQKDLPTVHTEHVAASESTVCVTPDVDDVRGERTELSVVAPSVAGVESNLTEKDSIQEYFG